MNDNEFFRGDLVAFQPTGAEKPLKGRVRTGPKGRHRVYTVATFVGEVFDVPEVLLEPLSN